MGIFSTVISLVILFSSLSFVYTKLMDAITNKDEKCDQTMLIANKNIDQIINMKNVISNVSETIQSSEASK